jgi:hypothetical protein
VIPLDLDIWVCIPDWSVLIGSFLFGRPVCSLHLVDLGLFFVLVLVLLPFQNFIDEAVAIYQTIRGV